MKKKVVIAIIFTIVGGLAFWFNAEKNLSKTAIDAIEKARGIEVDNILFQKDIEQGQVIFYLRKTNDDRQLVSAEFVKKTVLGWKWVYGGGHSVPLSTHGDQEMKADELWSHQYLPSTKGTEFDKSPFPMLFGVIKDPDITSIIVRNSDNLEEQTADILEGNNSVRFWYAFIEEQQESKLTISANSNYKNNEIAW